MTKAQTNVLELTVSELSFMLKKAIEEQFGYVRVRGELGRVSRPASGHVYLDIKDNKAVLNGVIWRGTASLLKCRPEEGLEVVASGKLTTFPGSSRYQIVIDNIEPAGVGALMALLEKRKKKLGREGLFDESGKKRLPFMPKVIGVVTSPTGSVIRDILHRLKDRFPLHVLTWPVRVQGESCAEEVARAIAGFNSFETGGSLPRPDVIIVARGGGSVEDLWGFNDEAAVRATAQSQIPVISAVGHETDWTLIDLAADARAPTPTAAAEMAVPVQAELEFQTSALASRILSGIRRVLDNARNGSRALARGLASPQTLLDIPRQRLDVFVAQLGQGFAMTVGAKRAAYEKSAGRSGLQGLSHALRSGRDKVDAIVYRSNRTIRQILQQRGSRLEQANRLLDSLSCKSALERGFAIILDENGKAVIKAASLSPGSYIHLRMQDGEIAARTLGKSVASPRLAKKSVRKQSPFCGQGDLF